MIIQQRRIRNLSSHLGFLEPGESIMIGLSQADQYLNILTEIGFCNGLQIGDAVLPSKNFGPVCRHNAEGKYQIHRDQPKETAYRWVEWHWIEFHGPARVEQSDIRPVPYERYPRSLIPPPSIELRIVPDITGEPNVATEPIQYLDENELIIKHTINLFLEIFGLCEVFTEDLESVTRTPTRHLNWKILPPGRHPWPVMRELLEPIISEAKRGNQPAIFQRLEAINDHEPDFTAIGHGGFNGYVVFGFPDRNLYVLESRFYGNATYVFRENWETLSAMTKAEILTGGLQEHRYVHAPGWHNSIRGLLGQQ